MSVKLNFLKIGLFLALVSGGSYWSYHGHMQHAQFNSDAWARNDSSIKAQANWKGFIFTGALAGASFVAALVWPLRKSSATEQSE